MGRSRALYVAASGGGGSAKSAGATASDSWVRGFGSTTPAMTRWHVEIALDVLQGRAPSEWDEATSTRFHVDVYTEEWGFYFCHGGRSSWIRVTDIPFVHGRDDFQLLATTPPLAGVGTLLRQLEETHKIRFQRHHATIKTNLPNIEPAVRRWVASL